MSWKMSWIALTLLTLILLPACAAPPGGENTSPTPTPEMEGVPHYGRTTSTHGDKTNAEAADGGSLPVTDFSDRRRLVGFVENVFVGRVVARTGTRYDIPADVRKPDDPGEPVYTVEVRRSIKGLLPDTVTLGPFDLEPGQEYLFATNPSPEKSGQIVVSGYGAVRIRDASHRTKLIEEFGRAYKEEITYTRAP